MEKLSQGTLICRACLLITVEIREIQLTADVSRENEKCVMGKSYNILLSTETSISTLLQILLNT